MWRAVVASLLLTLLCATSAGAFGKGGGKQATSCAALIYTNDGCAAEDALVLAGTPPLFVDPAHFADAAQSGQTFVTRPPWNVAGADYRVGSTIAVSAMADPTVANAIPGCTYSATGYVAFGLTYGGPEVLCSGGSFTINGFNFGPTSTHDCVVLYLALTTTQTATVTNNNFENGTACVNAANTLTPGKMAMVQFPGYSSASAFTGTVTSQNNNFNGHWLDPCCITPVAANFPVNAIYDYGRGNFVDKYNYMHGFSAHMVGVAGPSNASSKTITAYYNYVRGWGSSGAGGHGEIFAISAGGLNSGINVSTGWTITQPGTGATPGSYKMVPLTTQTGSGSLAWADITINGTGGVSSMSIDASGQNYSVGDTFSTSSIAGLSGFLGTVAAVYSTGRTPLNEIDWEYNTITEEQGACGECSATTLYPFGGPGNQAVTTTIEANNTIVGGNLAGGNPLLFSQMSGTIDDGKGTFYNGSSCMLTYCTDSVPGNVFTVTAFGTYTGTVTAAYKGEYFNGQGIDLQYYVGGATANGLGSQWAIECQGGTGYCLTGCSGAQGPCTTPTIAVVMPTSGLGSGYLWYSAPSFAQGTTFNYGNPTNLTIQNNYINYIESTALNNPTSYPVVSYPWWANGAACANPVSMSGNIDMLTGGHLALNGSTDMNQMYYAKINSGGC